MRAISTCWEPTPSKASGWRSIPSSASSSRPSSTARRMATELHNTGTMVETALGPVATVGLGPTLMHEHIVTRSPGVHENWPHLFDRDAVLALAERKMADLGSRGIRTIVDLTTVDLGREKRVEVLARLCAAGYAGKMVLCHDANCWTDMLSEEDKRRIRPRWHY